MPTQKDEWIRLLEQADITAAFIGISRSGISVLQRCADGRFIENGSAVQWLSEFPAETIDHLLTAFRECAHSDCQIDACRLTVSGERKRILARRLGSFTHSKYMLVAAIMNADGGFSSRLPGRDKEMLTRIFYDTTQLIACELDIPSGTLTLSDDFRKHYRTPGIAITNVPESILRKNMIREDCIPDFLDAYRVICSEKASGSFITEFMPFRTKEYRKIRVSWRKIFDDRNLPSKALIIIETDFSQNDVFFKEERSELSALRAKEALQDNYFKHIETHQKEMRRFRHDCRNNLMAVSALIDSNDLDGARKYIAKMGVILNRAAPIISTGNPGLDTFLSSKITEAKEAGIIVEYRIGLLPGLPADFQDLYIAVGNCIDNAIEACLSVLGPEKPQADVSIKLDFMQRRNALIFKMANSSPARSLQPEELPVTTKTDKKRHGYGLENVAQIVRKYHGRMHVSEENGEFSTSFTMFLREDMY